MDDSESKQCYKNLLLFDGTSEGPDPGLFSSRTRKRFLVYYNIKNERRLRVMASIEVDKSLGNKNLLFCRFILRANGTLGTSN